MDNSESMTRKIFFTFIYLSIGFVSFGQVTRAEEGIMSQAYSKDIAEYMVKEYVIKEILMVPDKQTIEVEINALTASKSGELTTVVYDCKELKKRGLIFGFWNSNTNEFNVHYKGYAFRNFEFNKAKELLDNLDLVLEEKKAILSRDNNENLAKNAVYKFDDVIFLFYIDELGSSLIRVMWNGYDSEWNQKNLKTMKKRFYKFFIPEK